MLTGTELHGSYICVRANREADPMTDADYRDMAIEIRELIPLVVHSQTVADLRLLADRYERLAQFLEVVSGKLSDTRFQCRRQAG